jgi:hypothetical protein
LLAGFALIGFTSLRMLALFALGAGPLWLPRAARTLNALAERLRWPGAVSQGLALSLLVSCLFASLRSSDYELGAGLMESRLPARALAELRRRGRVRRLYNAYNFGGYLMWQAYPPEGVFVDGRALTLYPAWFLDAFERAYHEPALFEQLFAQYQADGVLLPTHSPRTQLLLAYLRSQARFELVYSDEVASAFELRR